MRRYWGRDLNDDAWLCQLALQTAVEFQAL